MSKSDRLVNTDFHLVIYEDELPDIGEAMADIYYDYELHHLDPRQLAEDIITVLEDFGECP